jgi:hypothetical protein
MPFNGLMSTEVFQQSFMGLSIMDFSVNAGLNSSQSTLSVNLVADEGFVDAYETLDTITMGYPTTVWGGSGGSFATGFGGGFSMGSTNVKVGVRDAITEGYHPWDPDAFPDTLIQKFGGLAGVKRNYAMNGDNAWFPPPGSPVYFNYYGTGNLNTACVKDQNCKPAFQFSGILGEYKKSFSTSGLTYSTTISDPRKILENTLVILDGEIGRSPPADKHYLKNTNADPNERKYDHGWNGYYNIINVFGYYESHGFNKSGRNDQGIVWFDGARGKTFKNNYSSDHYFGVLPAIDFIASGTNDEYGKKHEPYGGPAYYGIDDRKLTDYALFAEQANPSASGATVGVHRYAIDLSALYDLNKTYNPNNPVPGTLGDSHRIEGAQLSLLQLIQQVCEAAGADFMVELYAPRKNEPHYTTHKDYAGIIKIIVIPRNIEVELGILEKAIDLSQEIPAKGPFVDAEQHPMLVSADVGYEFTDPIQGKVLFGSPRTRIVGITPLGDRKTRDELFYNVTTSKYLDGIPLPQDDILQEYLPSIEMDGVTLHTQSIPLDTFQDRSEQGWNPGHDHLREGGVDLRIDFEQNLPMVSNDDFLPFHFAEDYSGKRNDKGDPFQFGRVNSAFYEDESVCFVTPPVNKGGPFTINHYCRSTFDATEPSASGARAADPFGNTSQVCQTEESCVHVDYCNDDASCSDPFYSNKAACEGAKAFWSNGWLKITDDPTCQNAGNFWDLFYYPVGGPNAPGPVTNWKKLDNGLGSGYLDIFPCWGFEKTEYSSSSALLKDEVNRSVAGQPIKGMFWDDDPYRDFHPVDGIFGSFDWINPGLGVCRAVTDGKPPGKNKASDPPLPNQKRGMILDAWENNSAICECDYYTAPIKSECYKQRQAAGSYARGKFEPHCIAMRRCSHADGTEITEIHQAQAGPANNLHQNKFSCTQGCFEKKNGQPVGTNIIAYYTEDVGPKVRTQSANVEDAHWQTNPPGSKGSKIALIQSDEACTLDSVQGYALPPGGGSRLKRVVAPIKSDGSPATVDNTVTPPTSDGNTFKSNGGLYDKKCLAISYKYPWSTHCEAAVDLTDTEGNEYKAGDWLPSTSADGCIEDYDSNPPTGKVTWINAMTQFPQREILDPFFNQKVPIVAIPHPPYAGVHDCPTPGFVNARFMYTGVCKKIDDDTVVQGFPRQPAPQVVGPITDRAQCMATSHGQLGRKSGVYFDMDDPSSVPVMPKSATIPIDLASIGYNGGPFGSDNVPGGATNWYYATITELRHAAINKDSWTSYIRALGQKLPCTMWAVNPTPENAWSDFCKRADEAIFKGGASKAHLAVRGNLQHMAGNGGSPVLNNSVMQHAGNPSKAAAKSATGHPCGDPDRSGLSIGERTQMEVDIAYQKVQAVATQFYGRKYLVPLPFNPPTSLTCSNLIYTTRNECDLNGYDWGPHGMLSEWFQKMGVGKCSDNVSADKFTCEIINGAFWIDPIKHIDKWDVTQSGWPGGSIDYNWDETKNTGYPQNTNFWTDDGNLEPFVVFPSKERKRFDSSSTRLDFRNFDAESIHESSHQIVNGFDGWGTKVFIKAQTDPKTHWLPIRPLWEIQNEKQFAVFRAGDPDGTDAEAIRLNQPNSHRTDAKDDHVEVGTLDNLTKIKERPVYVRRTEPNLAPSDPDYFKEAMAFKPYALITLPDQVLYADMDNTSKFEPSIGEGKEMCIPLVKAKNSNSLMSAWLQGMDRGGIVGQQLRALAANLKNVPVISPDMGRGSFQSAAYKPFHAAIPQQSKYHKWGPWALGTGFGKVDYKTDTSLQPSSFGGEEAMIKYAMDGIKTTLQDVTPYVETGSVTLVGLPAHAFATQIILPINGVDLLGPFITDIAVSMGSGGLTTTYNFTTQEKFAAVDSINRERIRKNQEDMLKMLRYTEEQIARTKRDITKYFKS